MRLALAVGRLDVDAMLDELTVEQFEEWLAYDRVEGIPFPWLQTGVLAREVVNRQLGRREKPRRAVDFMPVVEPKKAKRTRDPKAIFGIFASWPGGVVKKEG